MCNSKSTTLNLLSLKKTTYLDKLRDSIPKLKGTIPNFGLPKWKYLPLESKIPMIPDLQENVYAFTRCKLGEPLRVRFVERKPFDMSDPYNYEVQMPYEGMHDEHLNLYFRKAHHVRDVMRKVGLITSQLDVKCSLKEYNNYRNYLRVMYAKLIREELEKRDKSLREKMFLNITELQTIKKVERLKKDEIRENLVKQLKVKAENKLQGLLKKDKEDNERVQLMNEMKYQMVQKKKMEFKKRMDYIKCERAIMAKREEQKILNTLKRWHERDVLFRKTKEQRLSRKHYQKFTTSLLKFEQKKNMQEDQMQTELFIKECAEKTKQAFIRRYHKKLDESQRKLQALLYFKKEALRKSLEAKKKKKKSYKKNICRCKITNK